MNTKSSYDRLTCMHIPLSRKVWQGKFGNVFWAFSKKVWQINTSAKRLLIVSTYLDSFSLVNHRWFTKFAKTFPLYSTQTSIQCHDTKICKLARFSLGSVSFSGLVHKSIDELINSQNKIIIKLLNYKTVQDLLTQLS